MHTKMAERQRDGGADPTTWDEFAMQKMQKTYFLGRGAGNMYTY